MRKYIATVLGFGSLCPTRLVADFGFRLNDLVAVLIVCAAVAAVVSAPDKRHRGVHIAYAALALLTIGWIGAEINFRNYLAVDPAAAMILVRWIVAIPAAFYLAILAQDTVFRKHLIGGAIFGCIVSSALLVFDFLSFQTTGRPAFESDLGALQGTSDSYSEWRLSGRRYPWRRERRSDRMPIHDTAASRCGR